MGTRELLALLLLLRDLEDFIDQAIGLCFIGG